MLKLLLDWLGKEAPPRGGPLCDFERIQFEIRPCDVLLIEGRSRISEVIRTVTQSAWSHACLYLGRLYDIEDPILRARVQDMYSGEPHEQLILESLLGQGTIIKPISVYKNDHIRICRPRGISRKDAQQVIAHAINALGKPYDIRQLFDLLRFFLPWPLLPRRWYSSLFQCLPGGSAKAVCSTVIAEAFQAVQFPILPMVALNEKNHIELIQPSPRLFTPRDFDYSPFFEIIKYPFIEIVTKGLYKKLPWNHDGFTTDGEEIIPIQAQSESTLEIFRKLKKIPKKNKKSTEV